MRWWRVFMNKIAGRAEPAAAADDPGGPRRRADERYPFKIRLQARCASWPRFVELFSGDVSRSGLFIPTAQQAAAGEQVEVDLTLPDGKTFAVTGQVVNVIDAARAADLHTAPGLGVRLDPLAAEARSRFDLIVAEARAAQPTPEADALSQTGSLPVHTALGRPQSEPGVRRSLPTPTGGPIIGVDMGTTYTAVASVRGKKVGMLARADGRRSTPSVISFDRGGEVIVGDPARERVATDPAHTVASPKRLLGRAFTEREVQTFVGRAPWRTLAGPDGTTVIEIWGREYAMPQLCSYLLADVRKLAEAELGEPVHRAVITVPISFDQVRIEALRRAGTMAGLEVIAVIDEPSAAALANRYAPGFGGIVGVYDFGGGTFDFSVVDVGRGDFRVLGTSGDTWLGGDDLDQALAEAAANQFWRQHKVDLRNQAVEWQRLLFACEKAKRELTAGDSAVIHVPGVLRGSQGMIDLKLGIDRATLRRACGPLIQRSVEVCDQALALLDMPPDKLSAIYLSGGTTHVPAVQEALEQHFRVPLRTGVPPEHAVCLGAAIHAAQLQLRGTATLPHRG
ncbi:MAG TPA: Hsp70 family protein [Kofleriaceae bacterium]|nr:Hsp70 family protein [Kofleriaceae bacterium]